MGIRPQSPSTIALLSHPSWFQFWGNRPWKPEAFERRNSLKFATMGSIIALTFAFLVYLWISVPRALEWGG
ncbi:hypothetical protein AMTRI_Chr11g97300 [Amborella trichopoda]